MHCSTRSIKGAKESTLRQGNLGTKQHKQHRLYKAELLCGSDKNRNLFPINVVLTVATPARQQTTGAGTAIHTPVHTSYYSTKNIVTAITVQVLDFTGQRKQAVAKTGNKMNHQVTAPAHWLLMCNGNENVFQVKGDLKWKSTTGPVLSRAKQTAIQSASPVRLQEKAPHNRFANYIVRWFT